MINRLDSTKTEASKRTYPLSDFQIRIFKRLKAREDNYRRMLGKDYHENDFGRTFGRTLAKSKSFE